MWYDADIDLLMGRTAKRPVPAGRISAETTLAFGLFLSVFSGGHAGPCHQLAVRRSSRLHNLFLLPSSHDVAQALDAAQYRYRAPPPPSRRSFGWACVTNSISLESIALFAIIFLWTPAHFWALALFKGGKTTAAPVYADAAQRRRRTRNQAAIVLYSVLTAISGIVPTLSGVCRTAYGIVAAALAWRSSGIPGRSGAWPMATPR